MKKFFSLVFALIMFTSIAGSAFAYAEPVQAQYDTEYIGIQPAAEVTVWKYREVNGLHQMRLWSETHGIWLTDWITI